ncbi:MAG: peptidoglycan editing factor PgeF [Terracidiphilus sp.]
MKRNKPLPTNNLDQNVQELDGLFARAGLVRSRRGTPAGITRELRLERAEPQELSVRAPEPRVAKNGVEWLAVPGWSRMGWLWHGFSTRRGGMSRAYCAEDAPGELNLGFTASDERAVVAENRRRLAEAITGSAETPLVTLRQVHSNVVVRAGAADAERSVPRKGDGLMTDEPGLLLAVQTADCIPVLVADTKRRVVAAFHAGWRGTVKRIVETGVGRMRLEFGCRPEDLVAAIGPGIGACCYAVGDEVLSVFESQFAYARELFREVYDSDPVRMKYPMLFLTQRAPGHSPIGPNLHVDLTEANRRQLVDAGVKAEAIRVVGGCTSCQRELFFSHRGSQGFTGRMMSVIGIRPR